MMTLLLVHGGLWEDVDAERFWLAPGITGALESRGFEVIAPDRLRRASNWQQDADHLVPALTDHRVTIIAGSNGCSAAVRLALTLPERVAGLVLAWPATAVDPKVDEWTRRHLAGLGATERVIGDLLAGEVLRGVPNAALSALTMPVGLLPSDPENPFHQRWTVDALKRLLPEARELPGFTEPPRPAFATQAESFADVITQFVMDEGLASHKGEA